jgi:hypothetical protein
MITRTKVAMYVSVEQSFFDTQGGVFDATSSGSTRIVDIKDSRRYNLQLFAFPKQFGSFRPYAGLGFAILMVRDANPEGTFASPESQDTVFARVDDQSSRTSPVFTLGGQYDISRFALFAQASTMATRNRFLINGKANTYPAIEAGRPTRAARFFIAPVGGVFSPHPACLTRRADCRESNSGAANPPPS